MPRQRSRWILLFAAVVTGLLTEDAAAQYQPARSPAAGDSIPSGQRRSRGAPNADSPRGKSLAALREFLQSTGDDALTTFIENHCAPSLRGEDEPAFRERLSKLREFAVRNPARGVRKAGSSAAVIILRSSDTDSNAEPASLLVEIERLAPHRITKLELTGGAAAPQPARLPSSDAELAEILGEYLAASAARSEFSGAVLVARGDEVLFEHAYGLAEKSFEIPTTVDTKFRLGSMNKMFTGVAVCQLAEQGKLSFDDKLIEHLPDYPNREFAERTTLHQLLTHTSGLGDFHTPENALAVRRARTVDEWLAAFAADPAPYEPDSGFHYSNAGAIVLGKVIEAVSGETYFDYVRNHIFLPVGMRDTDNYESDEIVSNLAIGYLRGPSSPATAGTKYAGWRSNVQMHGAKGSPGGGGYSTIHDMHRFGLALLNHSLISAATARQMLTAKVERGPGGGYAYLFGEHREQGRRWVGHNGGSPGVAAQFALFPDSGYCVVVLANHDAAAGPVWRFILPLIVHRLSAVSADTEK